MPKRSIRSIEELRALLGHELTVTDWVEVTQRRIDLFAEATGDSQWIHVEVERATRESGYGGTIAHGFLTLSLLGKFYIDDLDFPFTDVGLNYGLNKVRFTHPVRAGSRVRGRFTLVALDDVEGGFQMTLKIVFEIEGVERPACVAEQVVRRYYPKAGGTP